jgi:catechol 2,3-dioxygenase
VGESIHPQSRIGHVHLKVSDLDRSEAFYREVIGFEVTMRGEGLVCSCPPADIITISR